MEVMDMLIRRFLTPSDPVAHPIPILSGQDLMTSLSLPAGPRIGRLLAAIQLARAEGTVTTAEDALALAKQFLRDEEKNKGTGECRQE